MPATYEPIASQTLGTGTSTVTFSSIPGTYTDLRLVAAIRTTSSAAYDALQFTINGDTGSNYSRTELNGTGSAATSSRQSNRSNLVVWYSTPSALGASSFPIFTLDLMSYANTSVNKTILSSYADSSNFVQRQVHLWRSTSAITSLSFTPETGPAFTSGSTFSLFGIKASA